MPTPNHQPIKASRRAFLKTSTATISLATTAVALGETATKQSTQSKTGKALPQTSAPEWRNRNPDMTYRMLGRTGFMISEVVYGGYLMKPHTIDLYEAAIDRGLNYLDQATSYGQGDGERAIGALLKRGISRDRFFLTTKLSHYNGFVRNTYENHFKSLPVAKQQAIQTLADKLLADSNPTKPGYHVNYFEGQESNLPATYRVNAMKQMGISAGSKQLFKSKIFEILEQSMARTTVDHYDVLFCPHSVQSPESFDDEAMLEALTDLKKQGKARALAFSAHNDVGNNLAAATADGFYDAAMIAYNIVNHLALDPIIKEANAHGVGVIAMKVARPVIVDPLDWRIAKLETMIPNKDLSLAQKAYLFALQNPNLSAVISDMANDTMVNENLDLAGLKTELNLV